MANTSTDISERWYFTKEQLENSPSRKYGVDPRKELSYRQQSANYIQEMGQKLKVTQLCINTAIVYMHRFYAFHSFTHFPWYQMAIAALFLATKVEEQSRPSKYILGIANMCRHRNEVHSESYNHQYQDLMQNENVLLQTLGFDLSVEHPHHHVIKCCHLVRASKDLAQTSYFMASNSLHLTTMCLQYKPAVVACFCILVACKWTNWQIPVSTENKEWYNYVDPTVTKELLEQLTAEFLVIFEESPCRLKLKLMTMKNNELGDQEKGKNVKSHQDKTSHQSKTDFPHKHRFSGPHDSGTSNLLQHREGGHLLGQQKAAISGSSKVTHDHCRLTLDQKPQTSHSELPMGSYASSSRQGSRDTFGAVPKSAPFRLASKDYRKHKDIHFPDKHRFSGQHDAGTSNLQQQQEGDHSFGDKQKAAISSLSKVPHDHCRLTLDQKPQTSYAELPVSSYASSSRQGSRDTFGEVPKSAPFRLASKDYRKHKDIHFPHKHRFSGPHDAGTSNLQQQQQGDHLFGDKQKAAISSLSKVPHDHCRLTLDQKPQTSHAELPVSSIASSSRQGSRDTFGEVPKSAPFRLASKDYRKHTEIKTHKNIYKWDRSSQSHISRKNSSLDKNRSREDKEEKKTYDNRNRGEYIQKKKHQESVVEHSLVPEKRIGSTIQKDRIQPIQPVLNKPVQSIQSLQVQNPKEKLNKGTTFQLPPRKPAVAIRHTPEENLNKAVSSEINNKTRDRKSISSGYTPPNKNLIKITDKRESSQQSLCKSPNVTNRIPHQHLGPSRLPHMPNYTCANPQHTYSYYPHQRNTYQSQILARPRLPPTGALPNPPLPTKALPSKLPAPCPKK